MTRCPKCRSTSLRALGSVSELSWRRRWFGVWGETVPRVKTVALDMACADCRYAFVARQDGTEPLPEQGPYDALRSARDGAASRGTETGRTTESADEARPSRTPRPRL